MKTLLIILTIGYTLMAATITDIKIDKTKIPLIYEEDNNLPIITMQLVFQNSGALSTPAKSGLSKLSAKLLNEGSKKRGSEKFHEALDDKAIGLSVHAGNETLVFEVSSLKENFDKAIKLLIELLNDPNFSDESFEKVKKLILASIAQKESDFDYVASALLKSILFENTPMQEPQIGTDESISKLSLKDMKEFISTHLILQNAIVVIGGDINEKSAKNISKKVLNQLRSSKNEKLGFINVAKESKSLHVSKPTEQAYIYFGAPYFVKANDKDKYISNVAMFILGSGGFGSRMMEEIRVKQGLAYSAYSRSSINKTNNYFSGYLQTKLSNEENATKAVKNVIAEFVKNGATQAELDQAKKFILGSEPLRVETISQRLSRTFNEYYQGKKLGSHKEDLKKIEALDLNELNKFIKKHSEIKELSFAVVNNQEDEHR
jgi:zinc protease